MEGIIAILRIRFEKYPERHADLEWSAIEARLSAKPDQLRVLQMMEDSGGEPDVLAYEKETGSYLFFDCAAESPNGRRSLCYDRAALDSRKMHKPDNNVMDVAREMGIELLSEEQYRYLQQFGQFDTKTSSWIQTPASIRKLGGALFADYRYGQVFIYHNGAESYYAARAFRGMLRV